MTTNICRIHISLNYKTLLGSFLFLISANFLQKQKIKNICKTLKISISWCIFLREKVACLRFRSGFPEAPLILALVYHMERTGCWSINILVVCGAHRDQPVLLLLPVCLNTTDTITTINKEAWVDVSQPAQQLKCQVWMHCWESSPTTKHMLVWK